MDLDQHLIEECLGGRTAAFDELVRRYQNRLFNPVRRLVGCEEDAKDVIQDAFLLAYQSLHRFQGGSSFFTWLHRIAVNRAISVRRQRRVYRPLDSNGTDGACVDRTHASNPEQPMAEADRRQILYNALQRLSLAGRTVVVMCDLEQRTYDSIAATLKVSVGTVRSRLFRARRELRALLAADLAVTEQVPHEAAPGPLPS